MRKNINQENCARIEGINVKKNEEKKLKVETLMTKDNSYLQKLQ